MTYQEVHILCKRVSELNKRKRALYADIKAAQLEMGVGTAIQFDYIPARAVRKITLRSDIFASCQKLSGWGSYLTASLRS